MTLLKPKVAILIDAENIAYHHAKQLMTLAAEYGEVLAARAYGNFRLHTGWVDASVELGISLEHYMAAVPGKNGTDIAISIDVVDLLHTSAHDIVVLCTNDSDFIPLTHRVRRAGKKCIGIGHVHGNSAFRQACSAYHLLTPPAASRSAVPRPVVKQPVVEQPVVEQPVVEQPSQIQNFAEEFTEGTLQERLIRECEQQCSVEGGLLVSHLGNALTGLGLWPLPDTFGQKKLVNILRQNGQFWIIGSGVTVRAVAKSFQATEPPTPDPAPPLTSPHLTAPARIVGRVELPSAEPVEAEAPAAPQPKELTPWQNLKNEIAVIISSAPDCSIRLNQLSRKLKRYDPEFSPEKYGATSFRQLVTKAMRNVNFIGEGIETEVQLDVLQ